MTPNTEVTNSEKKIDLSFDKKEVFISFFCWNLKGKIQRQKKEEKNSDNYIKKMQMLLVISFLTPLAH